MGQTLASLQTAAGYAQARTIDWRPAFNTVGLFFANALRGFRAGSRHARSKPAGVLIPPLDIDRIAGQLQVVKRAQEDGRRNLPPSDEETPTGAQREVIACFTNLRHRARQRAAEWVEQTNGMLDQLNDSDGLARLRDLPAACESKILRFLADAEARLQYCAERAQKQHRYYQAFCNEHNLNRVAKCPGVSYLYYLLVPVMVAATSYILVSVLAPEVMGSGSLSPGWGVMVSVVAIVVPFTFGAVSLREINHINDFRKFVGWTGGIAGVAMILALAGYADFHIAAVLSDPETSNRETLQAVATAPLDALSDVTSWKIFGVFAATGLAAMLLGYWSDDTYPGYGAVQRSYYRARNAREGLLLRLRKRINAVIDEAEAEVLRIARDYKAVARAYTRMVRQSAQIPSLLRDYDADLEDACNIVLDRYRAANIALRESEAPTSFSEHVCFDSHGQEAFRCQSNGGNDMQDSVMAMDTEANRALQRLRDLNLRMIRLVAEPQFTDEGSPST